MVSVVKSKSPPPPDAQPAWDIARLFPYQGHWDEADYLSLDTNQLVEFTDGFIEVLAMPDMRHQLCVGYLFDALKAFISPEKLGRVLFAPFSIRLRPNKFRQPDVMLMLAAHADRMGNSYWDGADLVIEVVSPDRASQERDREKKRADYAEAGIPVYWIIDPQISRVIVLKLEGSGYTIYGEFGRGQHASSPFLQGFSIDVDALFAAANG